MEDRKCEIINNGGYKEDICFTELDENGLLITLDNYHEVLIPKDCMGFTDRAYEDFAASGHLYMVRLDGKDAEYRNFVITKMAEQGVATNVHYKPLPMMTAYKNLGFDIKDYPNAYRMFENEITLPLHTCLTDDEVNYVIDTFTKCI